MADPLTLTALLYAAAAAVGDATVKEVTKDAYGKLRDAVGIMFGRRASTALTKIEVAETREQGNTELTAILPTELTSDEATELAPLIEELVARLREDEPAKAAVQSRIGLDLDVGGNASIRNIQGVREMVVKARTAGDFTLDSVTMDPGRDPGK